MIFRVRKKATKLKIHFTLKFDKDGNVYSHKARMVFQDIKISTVNWKRICAPVVGKVTATLFLLQAAAHQMHLLQLDVTTAFLYGETL